MLLQFLGIARVEPLDVLEETKGHDNASNAGPADAMEIDTRS